MLKNADPKNKNIKKFVFKKSSVKTFDDQYTTLLKANEKILK